MAAVVPPLADMLGAAGSAAQKGKGIAAADTSPDPAAQQLDVLHALLLLLPMQEVSYTAVSTSLSVTAFQKLQIVQYDIMAEFCRRCIHAGTIGWSTIFMVHSGSVSFRDRERDV